MYIKSPIFNRYLILGLSMKLFLFYLPALGPGKPHQPLYGHQDPFTFTLYEGILTIILE